MKHRILIFFLIVSTTYSAKTQGFFKEEWIPKYFSDTVEAVLYPMDVSSGNTAEEIHFYTDSLINPVLPTHFANNAVGWMHFDWKIPGHVSMYNYKNAHINFMRMPGGNWSSEYFWTMEVPFPIKEEYVDPKTENWIMSNNDFMILADSLNAEPVICVNYSLALYADVANPVQKAAQYAADWVRKVNIEMGMDVTYWEIGNENFGPWQAGWVVDGDTITGDKYGRDFCVFVDSMKAVDPTIKIGAQMVNNDDGIMTYSGYNWWNKKMLPEVQEKADFLICHEYFTWATNPNTITVEEILSSVDQIKQLKDFIESSVEKYTDKPGDHFPIAMTEYNIRGGLKEISHVTGLFVAQALGEYIKNGYGMANLWDMINGYSESGGDHGILSKGEPGVPDYTPHASFFPYYFYEKCFGDQMVHSVSTNQNIKTYASTFSSGETGGVIVNLTGENKIVDMIFTPGHQYNHFLWYAVSSTSPVNRWFEINDIKPVNKKNGPAEYDKILPYYTNINKDTTRFVIKPYSMNYCIFTNSDVIQADIYEDPEPKDFFVKEWDQRNFPDTINAVMAPENSSFNVATINIDHEKVINRILPTLFGINVDFSETLNWEDEGQKLMDSISNLKIKYLRFPASGTNQYLWSGNIPFAVHEDYEKMINEKQLSIDHFIDLCQTTGAEPVLCVNYSIKRFTEAKDPVSKAASYAADWVRYMNIEKEMNVKYWEVGNENYHPDQPGYIVDGDTISGNEYGKDFMVFVDSMKSVDSSIFIGAQVKGKRNQDWNRQVLPLIQDGADYLVCQESFLRNEKLPVSIGDILNINSEIGKMKTDIENQVAKYTNKSADFFPVTFSSFDFHGGDKETAHISGIFLIRALNEFIVNNYGMSFYNSLLEGNNHSGDHGIISYNESDNNSFIPHPVYFPFYYLNQYLGDKMIFSSSDSWDIEVSASSFSTGETGFIITNLSSKTYNLKFQLENKTKDYQYLFWHTIYSTDLEGTSLAINDHEPVNNMNGSVKYEDIPPYYIRFDSDLTTFYVKPYSINYGVLSSTEIEKTTGEGKLGNFPINGMRVITDYHHNTFKIFLTIRAEGNKQIRIFNSTGHLVHVLDVGYKPHGKYMIDVDMNKWNKGIYMFQLLSEEGIVDAVAKSVK